MGEDSWPPALTGRTSALSSSTVLVKAQPGKEGVEEEGSCSKEGNWSLCSDLCSLTASGHRKAAWM